jgi:hypothetical protein
MDRPSSPDSTPPKSGRGEEAWRDTVVWFGLYYIGTGLWPILHLPSFLVVTGPKQETWLVQVFGALIASIGFSAILHRNTGPASAGVGLSAALVLASSDVYFVGRRRIRPTYLLDAVVEVVLAAGLARRLVMDSRSQKGTGAVGASRTRADLRWVAALRGRPGGRGQ